MDGRFDMFGSRQPMNVSICAPVLSIICVAPRQRNPVCDLCFGNRFFNQDSRISHDIETQRAAIQNALFCSFSWLIFVVLYSPIYILSHPNRVYKLAATV